MNIKVPGVIGPNASIEPVHPKIPTIKSIHPKISHSIFLDEDTAPMPRIIKRLLCKKTSGSVTMNATCLKHIGVNRIYPNLPTFISIHINYIVIVIII